MKQETFEIEAAHERLVMQNGNGTNGIVHELHLHECVTFGLMRPGIVNHFHAANGANPLEKILQIGFRSFIGEVANVEAGYANGLAGDGSPAFAGTGNANIRPSGFTFDESGRCVFFLLERRFVKTDKFQNFLPEGKFDRFGSIAAVGPESAFAVPASMVSTLSVVAALGPMTLAS